MQLWFLGLFVGAGFLTIATRADRWTVGVQSIVEQRIDNALGGPQALEGWVKVSHQQGTVRLVLGTIGNVEVLGEGPITEVRALQAGGMIRSKSQIAHWSALSLSVPAGAITRADYITFDNGWSIRPAANGLVLCGPSGCRPL